MTLGTRHILAITYNIQKYSKSPSTLNSTHYLCLIPDVVAYSILHRVVTAYPWHYVQHCIGHRIMNMLPTQYCLDWRLYIPHDESGTWYVGCAISKCGNIVFWCVCYRVLPLWLAGPLGGIYWSGWDHASVGHEWEGRSRKQFGMGWHNGGVQEGVVMCMPKDGPSPWLATWETL